MHRLIRRSFLLVLSETVLVLVIDRQRVVHQELPMPQKFD